MAAESQAAPLRVRLDPQDDDPFVLAAAIDRVDPQDVRSLWGAGRSAAVVLDSADVRQFGIRSRLISVSSAMSSWYSTIFTTCVPPDRSSLWSACSTTWGRRVGSSLPAGWSRRSTSRPQRHVRRTVAEFSATDLQLDRTQIEGLLVGVGFATIRWPKRS